MSSEWFGGSLFGTSAELLAQILDGDPVPTFVINADHVVTHWNRACEAIIGSPAAAMVGTRNQWRAFYPSERPVMADLIIDGALEQSVAAYYSGKYRRSQLIDGAFEAEDYFPAFQNGGRWLFFTAAPLRDASGKVVGAIETLQDITERKQAEGELRELNEQLEQRIAQRTAELSTANISLQQSIDLLQAAQEQLVVSEKLASLGSLVAGVAHEINTPVGIGVTASSMLTRSVKQLRQAVTEGTLKKSDLNHFLDQADEATSIVQANLQRAAELIRSFKQVAVDQTSDPLREIALHDYCDEVLTSLLPQLKQTRLQVHNQCDNLRLKTYPGAIYQILSNLVLNSISHGFAPGEPGEITLIARSTATGEVNFTYADNGRGIEAHHLGQIFDPFFTTRRGQGGTGLGLNIVYNLVNKKLNGQIRCESTPGHGVRFSLTFPATLQE
jgi:signal transduction histidine kinase